MKGGRAVAFHSSDSALLSNTSQSDSFYPLLCSSKNKNSDNNNDDNNYNDCKNIDYNNNNNENGSSRDNNFFNNHESSEERGLVGRNFNTNLIIHNSDWKPYNDPETGSVFW